MARKSQGEVEGRDIVPNFLRRPVSKGHGRQTEWFHLLAHPSDESLFLAQRLGLVVDHVGASLPLVGSQLGCTYSAHQFDIHFALATLCILRDHRTVGRCENLPHRDKFFEGSFLVHMTVTHSTA